MSINWEPLNEKLRELWRKGDTVLEISRKLSKFAGLKITQGAVAGQVYGKLKLPKRGRKIPAARHRGTGASRPWGRKGRRKKSEEVILPEVLVTDATIDLTIILTSDPCTWPLGHPGEKGYRECGERSVKGKPYCPTHCKAAYPEWKWTRKSAA